MSEGEQFRQILFENLPIFPGCPFCELFGDEIGVLNAPDHDFKLYSIHLWKDHFAQNDVGI